MQDLRHALRQFGQAPGFTVTVIVTLALGIGACTSMFSIVNAVLLRPLPYPEGERLVQAWDITSGNPSFPQGLAYKYWREESTTLSNVALSAPQFRTLTGETAPEQVKVLAVSANFLETLRVRPLLGQDFAADAEKPGGGNHVVLLTHALWQTRFGSDPQVVGRTIKLNDTSHTVVGVLAPGTLFRDDVHLLVPFVHSPQTLGIRKTARPGLLVTARLQPAATPATAEAELSAIMRAHAGEFGFTPQPLTASVVPLHAQLTGATRPTMLMLLGAGVLVLLIACANVANLLLARASTRAKEMVVRTALGATTGRIVRQVLAENLLLAVLGGGLAVLLSLFVADLLGNVVLATVPVLGAGTIVSTYFTGGEIPSILQPRVDWVVLAFACAIAAATGLGCGLFPALQACRADVSHGLKSAARGVTTRGRSRTQAVLVASEVALAATLLIAAGLFLRSFARFSSVDPGFRPAGLHAFDLSLANPRYADAGRRLQLADSVLQRLSGLPGIESLSAAADAPFGPQGLGGNIGLAAETDRSRDVNAAHNYVHHDFFRTLGMPLLRGRTFTAAENQPGTPRVLVVSETLATHLFGDQDPIGGHVFFNDHTWTVVGVVGNIRFRSLETGHGRFFYIPLGFNTGRNSVLIRSSLPAQSLYEMVRTAVRGLDPAQPVTMRSMTESIGLTLRGRQTSLALVNAFAAIALVLACLGIYAVMSYSINQRQRELGIRLALGASQPNVVGLVMRDGLRLTLLGLSVGLLAAFAGARLIASLLFGVSAHDPAVYAAALAALALIATLACWLPARRAAQADPIKALRAD